jgi:hypothetical protein
LKYRQNHTYAWVTDGRAEDRAQAMPAAPATTAQFIPQQMPVPLVAPKPGYVAPIAALNMSQLSSYDTARTPPGPNSAPMHHGQHGATMPPAVTRPRPPPVAPISVPSTPHPLPPTMTPILPVFARPSLPSEPDVNWGPEPIMRGNSEEKLIPRRGEKGDDFWRRFSMVAREESRKPSSQKQRCDYPCLFVIVAYLHSSVRGFAKPRAVRLTCQYGYGSSASSFSLYVPFLLM